MATLTVPAQLGASRSPWLLFSIPAIALAIAIGVLAWVAIPRSPSGVGANPTSTATQTAVPTVHHTPYPSDAPGTHTVRSGETLYTIAFALGVTEEQLRHWNYDTYPSLRSHPREIRVGWVLITVGPALPTATDRPSQAPAATPPPASTTTLVVLPVLTVDVWNATEEYHSITGRSPNEQIASARASAPKICESHQAAACAGPTTWDLRPEYVFDPSTGACTMLGFGFFRPPNYTAYLPQWTSPRRVPPALLDWWRIVLEHIRWHEEQHVRIFGDFVATLDRRAEGKPCSSAQALVNQWAVDLQAAQDAFDVADRESWRLPPYSGPQTW